MRSDRGGSASTRRVELYALRTHRRHAEGVRRRRRYSSSKARSIVRRVTALLFHLIRLASDREHDERNGELFARRPQARRTSSEHPSPTSRSRAGRGRGFAALALHQNPRRPAVCQRCAERARSTPAIEGVSAEVKASTPSRGGRARESIASSGRSGRSRAQRALESRRCSQAVSGHSLRSVRAWLGARPTHRDRRSARARLDR